MRYALLLILLLVGCMEGITIRSIRIAEELCEPFGGLTGVSEERYKGSKTRVQAFCVNGSTVTKFYDRVTP